MGKTPYETLKTENEALRAEVADLKAKLVEASDLRDHYARQLKNAHAMSWPNDGSCITGKCPACNRVAGKIVRVVHGDRETVWAFPWASHNDVRICSTVEDAKAWLTRVALKED